VEAASHLGSPHIEGLIAVAEAAIAYRTGDRAATIALAERAWKGFSGTGHPLGRLLAGALLGVTVKGVDVSAGVEKDITDARRDAGALRFTQTHPGLRARSILLNNSATGFSWNTLRRTVRSSWRHSVDEYRGVCRACCGLREEGFVKAEKSGRF